MSAKEIIARAAAEATPVVPETVHAINGAQPALVDLLAEQLRAERSRCQAMEEKLAALEQKNDELNEALRDAQNAAIERLERENERMARLQAATGKQGKP